MKNIAIILSGGTGTRFGGSKPKQFSKLAGKAVIEYTIDSFEKAKNINEIIIVSQREHIDRIWELAKINNWTKISKVVHGGKERFDSSLSALKSLTGYDDSSKILFHDAVRPLINEEIIDSCLNALDSFDAADVVIPSADTLVEVYDDGSISNIPNRSVMRRGQTPQAFRLSVVKQAYEKASLHGKYNFTCDCSVVRNMLPEVRVITVPGSEKNIKITHPLDLYIAEKLLQEKHHIRFKQDSNLNHLKDKNIVIFGGSRGIGHEIKVLSVISGANVHIASRKHNNIDITNLENVKSYLSGIIENHGDIDYIINTAGILIKKPLAMLTQEEIISLISINYHGAVNVAIAAKETLANKNGMLVNFTSSSYTRGRSYYALYSSAKAAIVNLTQALAEEWASEEIRVNCINPERTATQMRMNSFGMEPLESLLEPKVVAIKTLEILKENCSGIVIDVKKENIRLI